MYGCAIRSVNDGASTASPVQEFTVVIYCYPTLPVIPGFELRRRAGVQGSV